MQVMRSGLVARGTGTGDMGCLRCMWSPLEMAAFPAFPEAIPRGTDGDGTKAVSGPGMALFAPLDNGRTADPRPNLQQVAGVGETRCSQL